VRTAKAQRGGAAGKILANNRATHGTIIPTKGFHQTAQGCEETSYLGSARANVFPTLKELHSTGLSPRRSSHGWRVTRMHRFWSNPFRVAALSLSFPRVARSSQPWALSWNPVGIFRLPAQLSRG